MMLTKKVIGSIFHLHSKEPHLINGFYIIVDFCKKGGDFVLTLDRTPFISNHELIGGTRNFYIGHTRVNWYFENCCSIIGAKK
jgi:hypothetical protein